MGEVGSSRSDVDACGCDIVGTRSLVVADAGFELSLRLLALADFADFGGVAKSGKDSKTNCNRIK